MTITERAEKKRNKDLEKLRVQGLPLDAIPPLEEYVRLLSSEASVDAVAKAAAEAARQISDRPTDEDVDAMVSKLGIARRTWPQHDHTRPEYAVFNAFEAVWMEPDAVFLARLRSSGYFASQVSATPEDLVEPRAAHRAEMEQYKPRGTFADFVDGYANACPNDAVVTEYFGVEGDPGAYVSYTERGRNIGRWVYFSPGATPQVVRIMGEREGLWVQSTLGKDLVAARNAGKVLV